MEFISRKAAIMAVNNRVADFIPFLRGASEMIPLEIVGAIVRVPSAEVRPVVHGKWKQISPARIYECSKCGQVVMTCDIDVYKYCHGCGAKMEDDNETD